MEFTKLYNTLRYGQAAVSIARLRQILGRLPGESSAGWRRRTNMLSKS